MNFGWDSLPKPIVGSIWSAVKQRVAKGDVTLLGNPFEWLQLKLRAWLWNQQHTLTWVNMASATIWTCWCMSRVPPTLASFIGPNLYKVLSIRVSSHYFTTLLHLHINKRIPFVLSPETLPGPVQVGELTKKSWSSIETIGPTPNPLKAQSFQILLHQKSTSA